MKVAILHRYFWPESIAALPIMYGDLAEHHLEHGDDVVVCTGIRKGQLSKVRERFADRLQFRYFVSDIDRSRPTVWRAINGFRLLWASIPVLKPKSGVEMVYLATYPPLFALVVMLIGRVADRRRSHLLYLQDNIGYRLQNPWIRRLYVQALKRTIQLSTVTLVISDGMRAELLGYFDDGAGEAIGRKIMTLRNYSVDDDHEVNPGTSPSVDIVYAGNHGPAQNLKLFLRALVLLENSAPKVEFYGDGASRQELLDLASELGVAVDFFQSIPREQVAQRIMSARFGLVGAVPGLLRGAFPSKLASYTVLGVPALVMAGADDPESKWIAEQGLGTTVDASSDVQLALDLDRVLGSTSEESPVELAQRARSIFSKETYFNRLDEILSSFGLRLSALAVEVE